MDESKALHQLTEVADLVSMLEALSNVASADQVAPASWAGFRITLRSVRESVLASHDTLARELLQRAKGRVELPSQTNGNITQARIAAPNLEAPAMKFERRDLKASLEKYVEKTNS